MELSNLFTAFTVGLHSIKIRIRFASADAPFPRGVTMNIRSPKGTSVLTAGDRSPTTVKCCEKSFQPFVVPSIPAKSAPVSKANASEPSIKPVAISLHVRFGKN